MNPYDEQRLRDEVIYLHSLWHQGPPRNPNPPAKPDNIHNPSTNLHKPTNTTQFKKHEKFKKKKIFKKQNNVENTSEYIMEPDPVHDPGPEWLVNPTPSPPRATTGWPQVKPKSDTKPGALSAQEQAKVLVKQVQLKGLEACRQFFNDRDESDEEDDRDHEFCEESYLTENDGGLESEEYKFLLELFIKDDKLRGYYEKNHDNGDFCCLVCGGIGKKCNKRFKDCAGIVQHAITISKTKRKRAHRSFGQVVCKVLGWDIDRLPVIVLKGEPLGTSLVNSGVAQDEVAKGNADDNKEDNEGPLSGNNSEIVEKVASDDHQNDGELMICESSMKVDDAKKCVQNFICKLLNMEAEKGVAVDCQVDDASKCDENLDSKFLNMEADPGVAVDCQVDDVHKCVENLDGGFLNLEADKNVAVDCQGSGPSVADGIGWPCINTIDVPSVVASEWPHPQKPLVICMLSAEEQAKIGAVQLQQKVSEACREFFEKRAGSDGDEDEDDLMDEDGPDDSQDFKFFLKVFMENNELRSYYEQNYGGGEFCCLVCGGIGKKVWKRFKDCLGLLQHSTAISKTKKKQAHRAFGQVICKVLGWDIDSLPTIVSKGKPPSHSSVKLGMSLAEVEANADGNKDDISAPNNNVVGKFAGKEDAALTVSENSSNEDDINKHVNIVCKGILDMEGIKREQQMS